MDAHSFRQALERVDALRRERQIREALRSVEALLREASSSSELLVRRALLQQVDEDEVHSLDEIEQELRAARSFSPGLGEAQLELGHFLYAVRDRAGEAAPIFEEARRQAALTLKEALLGELKCRAELREWDAFVRVLEEAEQHFPGDAELALLREEHPDHLEHSSPGQPLL